MELKRKGQIEKEYDEREDFEHWNLNPLHSEFNEIKEQMQEQPQQEVLL